MCMVNKVSNPIIADKDIYVYKHIPQYNGKLIPYIFHPDHSKIRRDGYYIGYIDLKDYETHVVNMKSGIEINLDKIVQDKTIGYFCFSDVNEVYEYVENYLCDSTKNIYRFKIPKGSKYRIGYMEKMGGYVFKSILLASKLVHVEKE